jgi:hypothetical protein
MRKTLKNVMVGSMLFFGAAACADLDVVNQNDADARRALETATDIESLIAGAYNTWYSGNHASGGAGLFLSNAAFHHTAPWANFGMEEYARIPRIPIVNENSHGLYGNFTLPWRNSYRAISAIADGLRAIEGSPKIQEELGAERILRINTFARLVLGLAHAQLALGYDGAWVVDETTDIQNPGEPLPYMQLMEAAMGYLDEAISLAGQGSFTLPTTWVQRDVSSAELARYAHSMKARYRVASARTPAERADIDWAQVIADVDAGISEDFVVFADGDNGWFSAVFYYPRPGWAEIPYFIWGMADQSGNYQNWLAVPMGDKHPVVNGNPTLIITPDLRFPQGATLAEQQANPGKYFTSPTDIGSVWAQPGRGTWRWSYYRQLKNIDYFNASGVGDLPEITVVEMQLLKAEGLYRMGDRAGAAAIINVTRTANGLNPTDASGTNTSCVPKLPSGECGDLFEMLKWEKRNEVAQYGPLTQGFYFDSRGWGDLWKGTYLQFPAPCQDLEILGRTPCYSFGGVGGEMASPGSSYNWPHEN